MTDHPDTPTDLVQQDERTLRVSYAGNPLEGAERLVNEGIPTQVANPRRTTLRSIVWLLIALASATPQIVPIILGAWDPQWLSTALGQVLLVHGVVTRIVAIEGVNAWIVRHLPALAAIPVVKA